MADIAAGHRPRGSGGCNLGHDRVHMRDQHRIGAALENPPRVHEAAAAWQGGRTTRCRVWVFEGEGHTPSTVYEFRGCATLCAPLLRELVFPDNALQVASNGSIGDPGSAPAISYRVPTRGVSGTGNIRWEAMSGPTSALRDAGSTSGAQGRSPRPCSTLARRAVVAENRASTSCTLCTVGRGSIVLR